LTRQRVIRFREKASFAKSSAKVDLSERECGTPLSYFVNAQIGGWDVVESYAESWS
jgi:carbon monoxide dehydrogenase subunit G